MKKTILFWTLAFIITIGSAVFQRMTGPSYPKKGEISFEGKIIHYKLERSHVSSSNYKVEIETGNPEIKAVIKWRKFKTLDEFNVVEMKGGKVLSGEIPAQAPLEKIEYFIELSKGEATKMLPDEKTVVIRFKGDVPIVVLIPHIIAMFAAMILSTRTAFEGFVKEPKLGKLTYWTLVILFIGGFPLGFAMNWYAFGQMWGGIPFGNDITDNKTLIAFVGWIVAYYMIKKNQAPKLFAILAALLMLIVYMIPHSV
jgi:hypothetical protein